MAKNEKLQKYKEYIQKRYPKDTHYVNKYLTDEYVVISRSDFNHVIHMIITLQKCLCRLSSESYELSKYVERLKNDFYENITQK